MTAPQTVTTTPAVFVDGHDIVDCRDEFGPHDEHAECESVLRLMAGVGAPSDFGYDPTGCRGGEVCATCGETNCDRFDEPAPAL